MSIQNVTIKEVTETDDFTVIYKLLNETGFRFLDPLKKGDISLGESPDELKQDYCRNASNNKGFIALDSNNDIIAFMGITLSNVTKNGYIQYGFSEGHEEVTVSLLQKCSDIIKIQGGTKIFKFVPAKFGQIRNEEITFFEKFGFVSDEYSYVTTLLSLDSWERPVNFDSSGIDPVNNLDVDTIQQILLDDDEDDMAELFKNQFSSSKHRNQVILVLRETQSKEIAGVAYYRVGLAKRGEVEFLEGTAFGVHFRPKFALNIDEKRRFIQGALQSMKELDIKHVLSRLTLKNFDTFAAMIKEGFHNQDLEELNIIRLYKSI